MFKFNRILSDIATNPAGEGNGSKEPSLPPLFSLGRVVATPGAIAALSDLEMLVALGRHQNGDWGLVGQEDGDANSLAVIEGTRILSAYESQKGERIWVITEADRSVTTILLPSEY